MMQDTLKKFGDPDTRLCECGNWLILLRPQQVTLGALILIEKNGHQNFSDLTPESFSDLKKAVGVIETTLGKLFGYEKINYLMLMMVDPEVHFHVIPRYSGEKVYGGVRFSDAGWPGPPDMGAVNDIPPEVFSALAADLTKALSD